MWVGCLSAGPSDAPPETPPADPPKPVNPIRGPGWGRLPANVSAEAATRGHWEEPFQGERAAVNLVLLKNGRVLYWSGVEANKNDSATQWTFFTSAPLWAESRVLDLSGETPLVHTPDNPQGAAKDLFCAGQTILADGRVLAIGSSDWKTLQQDQYAALHGGADARVYNPDNNTWIRLADMKMGRWYPTLLKLPDGTPLAASGIGVLPEPQTQRDRMETYDAAANAWSFVDGADNVLPLYPRITVVPGGPLKGRWFYNTVATLWGPFGEHPLEATWSLQQAYDPNQRAWQTLGRSFFGARQHAASVLLPLDPSRDYTPAFVTFGGTLQRSVLAVPFTELNDLSTSPPTNRRVGDLHHPRWHVNGVGLPDGTVLAVGGGLYDNVVLHGQENVPVLSAELYDPATGGWTELASMRVPRMYHSTAILLPDARVLVAGHVPLPNPFPAARQTVNPQTVETRLEIFDPPYLFRGERPGIEEAPASVEYGEEFAITVSGPEALHSVVLVHPGATTHSYDMTQRTVLLQVVKREGDEVTLRAPRDALAAPPGPYMLFVNAQHAGGAVPSIAWMMQVSAGTEPDGEDASVLHAASFGHIHPEADLHAH